MKPYDPKLVKYDFFDTAVAGVLQAIDGGTVMGSFILGFCCIDYMGMALDPMKDKNTSADFRAFVTDYMAKANEDYAGVADELWAVRNGIIHTYGDCKALRKAGFKPVFSHQYPEYHLRVIEDPDRQLWVNLPEFVSELIAAVELFFRLTTSDVHLHAWYGKLIGMIGVGASLQRLGVIDSGALRHGLSHPAMGPLDERPPLEIPELRNALCSAIHQRLKTPIWELR